MYGGETNYDLLWITRQLYTPKDVELSLVDKVQLTINFSKAYQKIEEYPELKQLKKEIQRYHTVLTTFGLRDMMVRDEAYLPASIKIKLLLKNVLLLLVLSIFALPGGILMAIPGLICTIIARRSAKDDVKHSLVKITGKDVMLSVKVLI